MASQFPQPRRFGEYDLFHTLGKGASGKVKLGRDRRSGEAVAVKIMYTDAITVNTAICLDREVKALSSLKHPHILQLRDVYLSQPYVKKNGQIRTVVALVLELAAAGELFDFIMHTGRFPEPVARSFFKQLLSAMAQCHNYGVSHRDLKPENVLLDEHFQLKVADFGLSSTQNKNDLCTTRCGTANYMSPEVFARETPGYDGEKADVWSAGVLLFIMIAGNPPFTAASTSDWHFKAIKSGRYDRFWWAHMRTCPDFPPLAQDLLNGMFRVNPQHRPTFEQVAKHPWLDGEVWSHTQLEAELTMRKHIIEKTKAAQQANLLRRKRSEANGIALADPFTRRVVRSPILETASNAAMLRELGSVLAATSPQALLTLLADILVSCTSIRKPCMMPEDEYWELPCDSSEDDGSDGGEFSSDQPVVTVKAETSKVKAFFPKLGLEVVIHVFSGETQGSSVAEIVRLQGDPWDFKAVREIITTSLISQGVVSGDISRSRNGSSPGEVQEEDFLLQDGADAIGLM